MNLKYHIISLGCSKNQSDSERLNAALIENGFVQSEDIESSDFVVINTCGFIQSAKEESIAVILDSLELKLSGAKIAVIGCLSERYKKDILADIPEIDLVYGLYDDGFIPEVKNLFSLSENYIRTEKRIPLELGLPYEYIKIAEGCSNRCSFCAIPIIRGDHVSFSPDSIYSDAIEAASRGAKELIIVAQDIASYSFGSSDLCSIVDRISQIKTVEWIRLMYIHPDHLSDKIIKLIASNDKVVKYIDIPFQHASEKILCSMNRKGSSEKYLNLIERLRAEVNGIKIRSTFMVGYPGETDEDFNELLEFMKKARIDKAGAFVFSPEENTPAAELEDNPSKIKKRRFDKLMKLQQEISRDSLLKMVGQKVKILVEEKLDEFHYAGRTEYDAPEVDGVFYLTDEKNKVKINGFCEAVISDSTEYDLIGEYYDS